MAYEVEVVNGKLLNRLSQEPIHTVKDKKWIFVMDAHGRLYISQARRRVPRLTQFEVLGSCLIRTQFLDFLTQGFLATS